MNLNLLVIPIKGKGSDGCCREDEASFIVPHRTPREGNLQCIYTHTLLFRMQMFVVHNSFKSLPLTNGKTLKCLKKPPTGNIPVISAVISPKYVFWVVGQNNPFEQRFAHMSHLFISLVFNEKVKAIKPTCLARVGERRRFTAMKWNSQQMSLITQQLGGKEIMWSSFSHQLRISVHKNRNYWGEIQTT